VNFLEKVANGDIAQRLAVPRGIAHSRSTASVGQLYSMADGEPSSEGIPEDEEKPELAYYGVVSDVPLQFNVAEAERAEARGLYADILRQIAQRESVQDSIMTLYQRDIDPEMVQAAHLIGWLLRADVQVPKWVRFKTVRELTDKVSQLLRHLAPVVALPGSAAVLDPDPLTLATHLSDLLAARSSIRVQLKAVAQKGDPVLLVRANLLLGLLDRLLINAAQFPGIDFDADDFRISVLVLGERMQEMKKYRCYRPLRRFYQDHFKDLGPHFHDLFTLLDAVRSAQRSQRIIKAEQSIRACALLSRWIYAHASTGGIPTAIEPYDAAFHFPRVDVELDGIDLGAFRLPSAPQVPTGEPDANLVRCDAEISALSQSPLAALLFFRKWLPFLRQVNPRVPFFVGIEKKWRARLRALENSDPGYRSPLILLRLTAQYSATLADLLTATAPSLPDALARFAKGWVQYFKDLQTQFGHWAAEFSSRVLIGHLVYIKGVAETVATFKVAASKLDDAAAQTGFWFVTNSVHVCVVKLLDFLTIFDRSETSDLLGLFRKCYKSFYVFRLSAERRFPHSEFLPFYQIFAVHNALFLRLFGRYAQTLRFSRHRLGQLKLLILELSGIAHLGEPEKGRELIEGLSILYSGLWKAQSQEGAISQAILTLSNLLIRLIDRLAANLAGDLLDTGDVEPVRRWVAHLKQKQLAFAGLVTLYESEQSVETRARDSRLFQDFMTEFEALHAQGAQLAIAAIVEDTRNAIVNVISNFTTADASDLVSTTFAFLSVSGTQPTVSTFEFGSSDGLSAFSQQVLVSLSSSSGSGGMQPTEGLRYNSRDRSRHSGDKHGFHPHKRASILRDPNSPINQEPSGRHISFGSSAAPVQEAPMGAIDPDMLLPFVPNPPFLSWDITSLQKRITFPAMPQISLPPSGVSPFHTAPFTVPAFRDVKGLTMQKLWELFDQQIDKSPAHSDRQIKHDGSLERLSSLTDRGDITQAVTAATRKMRAISAELRNQGDTLDTFERLEFVKEHRVELINALPGMVRGQSVFPNEELVLDAVREYENIREQFVAFLDGLVPIAEEQTLDALVSASAKQLAVIGAALSAYSADERLAHEPRYSQAFPRVISFVDEALQSFHLIADARNSACAIASRAFFLHIGRSLSALSPFFDEVEGVLRRAVLAYARDLLLASLDKINNFGQILDRIAASAPEDLDAQRERALSAATALATTMVARVPSSDMAICGQLIRDCLTRGDCRAPSFLLDLEHISPIVESVYVGFADRQSELTFGLLLCLRLSIMLTIGPPSQADADPELCRMLKEVEMDLNWLASFLQAGGPFCSQRVVSQLAPKWKESIHRMILGVAELRESAGVLRGRPALAVEFESFLADVSGALTFFDGTKQRGVDISHIYPDIAAHITETRNYLRRMPRTFVVASRPSFCEPLFDCSRFDNGFTSIVATRELERGASVLPRILSLLRRSFNARCSTAYCASLIQLIADVHVHPLASPDALEASVSALPVPGIEPPPSTTFERQRLVVLLCTLRAIARLAELELSVAYGTRRTHAFRSAAPAVAELNAQLAKLIEGSVCALPSHARSLPELMAQLKPFYADVAAITRRIMILDDEEKPKAFAANQDQRDALRYIPRAKPTHASAAALFEAYEREFNARSAQGVVAAFVKFFRTASGISTLRTRASELREALAALFEKEADGAFEGLLRLHREVARRAHLLESDSLAVVKSILSAELLEFPTVAEGPVKLVTDNVCDMAILLVSKNEDDIEKVREMAVLVETLADITKEDIQAVDAPTRKRFLEIIEKAFRIVSPEVAGAFQAKMNLLLFLFHIQISGSG
jgi:hypothetical protein